MAKKSAADKAPSLTAAVPVVRNIGSADLGRYFELKNGRAELEAKARVLKRQEDALAEEIKAYAIKHGGKMRSVVRCGFRLSVISKPGAVSWLTELQKVVGPAKVEELKASAPSKDSLSVERA